MFSLNIQENGLGKCIQIFKYELVFWNVIFSVSCFYASWKIYKKLRNFS